VGAPDVSAALRNSGRLSINPTNLATDWPHGGTGLGSVAEVSVAPNVIAESISAEEFGTIVEALELGQSWTFGAFLRNVTDSAVLTTLFGDTSAGTSGRKIVWHRTASRAGTLLSSRSVKLLFTPDDASGDAVLFYRALPLLEESAELAMQIEPILGVPALFRAIRDSDGDAVAVGKLSDLTL